MVKQFLWRFVENRDGDGRPSLHGLQQMHCIQITVYTRETGLKYYFMAELVHGEKEQSDWCPEQCIFCSTDRKVRPLTN